MLFLKEVTKFENIAEFSLTPSLDYFTPTFYSESNFSKVPIEKYGNTPSFSGKQHFYSHFQKPSENSVLSAENHRWQFVKE